MAHTIYLGDTCAAMRIGERAKVVEYSTIGPAALADCFSALRTAKHVRLSRRVDVLLSSSMARPFVIQPVEGARSLDEIAALARSSSASATGLSGDCSIQLEPLPKDAGYLAVAVRTTVIQEIRTAAAAAKLKVASVRPLWACAIDSLNKSRPRANAVVVVERDAATVVVESATGYGWVQTLSPAPNREMIEALARRIRLGTSESNEGIPVASVILEDWTPIGLGLSWSAV
jgi:hypothetical protein